MLGIYLFVALNVFKTDKLAYVYESSSSVAKTLSAQFTTEMSSLLNSGKPVMQEYLLKNKFSEISNGVFNVESPILWMVVYAPKVENPSLFDKLSSIEKEGIKADADLEQLANLNGILLEALSRGRVLQVPFKDDRVLLVERVGDGNPQNSRLFVLFAKFSELANVFRNPGANENYLINEKGKILFGPGGSEAALITEKTGTDFLGHISEQKFSTGAEGVKANSGEDYLASYAKAGFGGATVVSLVPQSEALKAVKVLVIRSLLFMMILVSVTVIISLFASSNLTSALSDLSQATDKVAEGHFDIRVKVTSTDEVGSLAESFNAMASEVARLMSETAEKARMESELKTAQTVQETLFPPNEADFGDIKISGFYEPASECGGDWWHYCEVNEKVYLWIGDATGHGAPAALITSAAKSAATIIERLNVEPDAALNLLNQSIHDVSKGKIMMTFFIAQYDKKTRTLSYSNASHEAPYLIRKTDQPLKKKDLIPLNEVNNPRLGQNRDTQYAQTKIQLEPGDRLFFYTDGLLDIQNEMKLSWGEREFIKALIQSNSNFPPVHDAVKNLEEKFKLYRQGTPLIDDITFFMSECT